MSVRYLGLADYVAIAVEVTGLDAETVMRAPNLGLADSALHAPAGIFDETEFYPDFVDKAAVLVVRLAKNHPLPDGNKRAAWVALRLFVEINVGAWSRRRPLMMRSGLCSLSPQASGARPRWRNGFAIS
ncbi:MAG: hypothetical protein GEU88_04890 [Solirubrobacterales bacterium]|nr:hypothetical protein [Solirubrobacterales bacterium]